MFTFFFCKCYNCFGDGMDKSSKKYIVIIFLCVVFAIVAKLCNYGFLALYPFSIILPIHSIIFIASNYKFISDCKKTKKYRTFWLSCTSFVLAYLFLPDYPKIETTSCIFGVITDSTMVSRLGYVSLLFFVINVVSVVLEIVFVTNSKMGELNRK